MPRMVRAVETRIALGLAVALAWSLATTTGGTAQDVTCAAPTLSATVAMPGGDAAGATAQPGPAPDSPGPCWTWSIDGYTGNPDERDIVAVGDVVVTVGRGPTVIALDATDGSERWSYPVTNDASLRVTGLTAADGVVYAAGPNGLSALGPNDGSVRWEYVVEKPDGPYSQGGGFYSPAAVGGLVYGVTRIDDAAGNSSYSLVAVDAATGAERWALPPSTSEIDPPASDGSLVAAVFYTMEDDLRWPNLGAFDAATGASRWVSEIRDVEQWPTSRPVVTQDLVYLGSQNGDIVARSAADGSREWRTNIDFSSVESITVADGNLYAMNSKALRALNAKNGKMRWEATPKVGFLNPRVTPAAVQGGPVIVGAQDYDAPGWLYAFDPKKGKQLWRVETGPSSSRLLSPIVSGGRVVLHMPDPSGSRVVSFGTP